MCAVALIHVSLCGYIHLATSITHVTMSSYLPYVTHGGNGAQYIHFTEGQAVKGLGNSKPGTRVQVVTLCLSHLSQN